MALTKITNSAIADDIGLGGNPTTSTQTAGDSTTRIATTAFVSTAVANLVDSAPDTLNTLAELATAIGSNATLSSTLTSSIATKLPLAGGTLTGNLNLGDNVRARFGLDSDLQIYHSGTESIIADTGTGHLYIRGQNLLLQNADGSKAYFSGIGDVASLYYGTSEKLATTATGIDVTGNIGVTGTVDGIDIAARDAVLTSTTTTAGAALPKAGGTMTGALVISSATDQQLTLNDTSGAGPYLALARSNTRRSYIGFGSSNNNLNIVNEYADGATIIGSGNATTLTLDSSQNATFAGTISVSGTVDGVDIATRDAVLTSTTTTAGAALPKAGGTLTGALTGTTATFIKNATAGTNALNILGASNGNGTGITFSDNGTPAASGSGQNGYFTYYHGDSQSYGSGNAFVLSSSESTTTILADGKLMYTEGLYIKPSSGTGAGTLLISSSGNLTNIGTISSGAITAPSIQAASGSFSIKRSNDGTNAVQVLATGEVLIGANYLYVTASAGAYFSNAVRFRGTISNDTGTNVTFGQPINVTGGIKVGGTEVIDSTRQSLRLNSFASGGGAGIFFRDGFTYNCSITAEDHNGSSADGICISGSDGISFSTGANTKNVRGGVDLNGNFYWGGSTVIDANRNITAGDVNITSAAPTIFFTDSDGTNQNTTVKQSGGNFFIIARDNTANAGVVFAGNAGGTYDEYARFKADGNFGIGTNNPTAKLHISGNSDVSDEDCQLIIDDVDGSAGSRIPSIQFRSVTGGTTTNQGRIRATDTQGMILSGSSAQGDDLVVQAGNVGIGTSTPEKNLSIGSSQAEGIQFNFDTTNNYRNQILNYWNSSADSRMDFNVARASGATPSTIMSVGYNSSVGIGTTTPAQALQVNGNIRINHPDGGGAPADTAIMELYGYEQRGVGLRLRDQVNSAASASNREWFIGSGYGQAGFNIGYASDGSQSSYAAQNKLTVTTDGKVGIGTSNPAFKLVVAHNGRNGMEFVPSTDDTGTNIIQNYNRGTAAYTPLRIAGNSLTLLSGTNAQHSTSIDTSGNIATSGNINLTGGGTIEAPSVGGGETLTLKAAGGITAIIDSNGNGGDDQFFSVQKHTGDNLLTVQENGAVEVAGTLNSGGTLSATASVGVNQLFKSTYNYGPNRDWAIRTNNYGSSNWGGWSLEQSGEQQGTPDIARIGVHANGNVGIKMGGHASSGLTTVNPATALHVGGDITVGTAESVGTGAASAIRFVNDNERSRITSNYASGGGGEMGFWTDTTGGTLFNRAYIKNDGSFNFNGNVKMHSNHWNSNDVLRAYSLTGPSTTSLTRTINVNSYWGFGAQGGAFMFMIHGWQADSATGMVHWHNNGSNNPVITGVYLNEFHTATGLTVSVAKGTGDYDINISLASTHSNTHGWYWKVWA